MNENTLIERQMLDKGAERYLRNQLKAADRNELTSAENKLFTEALGKVAAAMQTALEESGGRGRPAAWVLPLQELGPMQCALVTLRLVFAAIGGSCEYANTIVSIGRQIEVELIGRAVAEKDEALYKKLLKRVSKLRSVEFKSKVFMENVTEAGFWDPLSEDEQSKIGAGLLNFVLQSTDMFETVLENAGTEEQRLVITLTEEASVRLDDIGEMEAWMRPVYMPMLTKPRAWETAWTGCYEDPKLAGTVKIIRTATKSYLKKVDDAVRQGATFVRSLNHIQEVPLQANPFVVEWLDKAIKADMTLPSFPEPVQAIPKDATKAERDEIRKANTERASLRKDLLQTAQLAKDYERFGTFYLPSSLDWRGRVYAKPHLNHQREDHCKALFQFDEGQVLTAEGAVWLAIHVCNSGAFKRPDGKKWDKAPLNERWQWTRDNTDRILKMVEDPAADLWWTEADSPFMFLAACEAWAGYVKDPDGYVCRLPVGVDGSCSGLQHFSAMLRDPVGGSHVNLLPGDEPADVYQVVADVVLPWVEKDAAEGHEMAARWLQIGINRKIAKRCVMTYVYGSKQFGFAEHLADDFNKELTAVVVPDMKQGEEEQDWEFKYRCEREIRATAMYLAKYIWEAVQSTVKAAADAMEWLQKTTSLLASEGLPMSWVTPSGFPVTNAYYEPTVEKMQLLLWDRTFSIPKRIQPRITTGYSRKLLGRKCRSSISPNFVHSLDAAHLHLAVQRAHEEGIKSVLLIHDSFSCLPNDMPRFVQIVRETFVEMYLNNDPLNDLYEYAKSVLSAKGLKELTPPPAKGTLDLEKVLESHYAFA